MTLSKLRVIKLGGSLLNSSDFASRLRDWRKQQEPKQDLLIVGGGAFADAVRTYGSIHRLDEEMAHWLAIDAMTLAAKLVHSQLSESTLLEEWKELDTGNRDRILILDVCRFLRSDHTFAGDALPTTWDVTSDSIAARVAEVLMADEIVLLKSCSPVDVASVDGLANAGHVDRSFPKVSTRFASVRLVNLRDEAYSEVQFSFGKRKAAEQSPPLE